MENRIELKYILSCLNDLLKFGEAKHAGLVILNSGLTVGILTSYSSINHLIYKPMVLMGCIAFGISVFLSIISQFPMTSNTFYNKKDIVNPNIYFFEHLACFDNDRFIKAYKEMDPNFVPTKFHTDLINQILVISRIARSKFLFFKAAAYITALGIGIIGISTIFKLIFSS